MIAERDNKSFLAYSSLLFSRIYRRRICFCGGVKEKILDGTFEDIN